MALHYEIEIYRYFAAITLNNVIKNNVIFVHFQVSKIWSIKNG